MVGPSIAWGEEDIQLFWWQHDLVLWVLIYKNMTSTSLFRVWASCPKTSIDFPFPTSSKILGIWNGSSDSMPSTNPRSPFLAFFQSFPSEAYFFEQLPQSEALSPLDSHLSIWPLHYGLGKFSWMLYIGQASHPYNSLCFMLHPCRLPLILSDFVSKVLV